MIYRTSLQLFLFPLLASAANLRGGLDNAPAATTNTADAATAARQRRLAEIEATAQYWTKEHVLNAIPRDALVEKVQQAPKHHKRRNERHLTVFTEHDRPAPSRMDDESIHMVHVGNSIMECTLRHDFHDEATATHYQQLRHRDLATAPTETRISPAPNAKLTSSYIDFVVDVQDADDDIYWIAFFLKTENSASASRTKFQPKHGSGRYTLKMGPFPTGNYEWGIRVRDDAKLHSSGTLQYNAFSVQLPAGNEVPTLTFPTGNADDLFHYHTDSTGWGDRTIFAPPSTGGQPTVESPDLGDRTVVAPPTGGDIFPPVTTPLGGDVAEKPSTPTAGTPPAIIGTTASSQAPPETVAPPTTTTVPTTTTSTTRTLPTTTRTLPTTTTSTTRTLPTTIGGGGSDSTLNFVYFSPATTGATPDPVTFEWQVTGDTVHVLLLYVKYPDGGESYLTRQPTATGRDFVTTSLNDKGTFEWAIWAQTEVGTFQQGPWQKFEIQQGAPDPNCPENLGHFTDRNHDLHKAIGRIVYTSNGRNYLCSGTLVDGANDRAVIATAAHCIYDSETGSFPSKVMFIPGQDDGEGDSSDYNCFNDPHGCFYPTAGVISDKYKSAAFSSGFQYDYGFYIAPDTDPGNNSETLTDLGGSAYKSLKPMGISFKGMDIGKTTYLYGYPGSRDPNFMYTEGRSETSPVTQGGWYVDCSRLSGGASGGPWTQTNPNSGRITVMSVNSWGWTDGDSGMGSPPFDTGGAECVFNAANAAAINGGYVVETCPE